MSITDKFNYLKQTKENLKEVINLVKDEDEDKLTEESTFRSYPEALRKNYIKALNEGSDFIYDSLDKVTEEGETVVLDNTAIAPMKISLNGNISQEKIDAEVGTEIVNTEISTSDVNNEKENYITLQGNTYQETIEAQAGSEIEDTELAVNDVDASKENYITLNGNTSQETTTGKNLFDKSLFQNFTDAIKFISLNLKPNTQYTVSSDIPSSYNSANLFALNSTGNPSTTTNGVTPSVPRTVTTLDDGILRIGYRDNGNALEDEKDNYWYQLEQGSTATSYEPYTGGQPSPSPDYPQQVKVVKGENVVSVSGKNLFDKDNLVQGYISDTILDNRTSTTRTNAILLKAGTYTYSFKYTNSVWVKMVKYDNATTTTGTFIFNSQSANYNRTFTLSEDTYVRFGFDTNLSNILANATIQLELGSTATPYVPYSKTDYEVNLGKNLFDYQNQNYNAVRASYVLENNGLKITSSGSYAMITTDFDVEIGKTYTISFDTINSDNIAAGIQIRSSTALITSEGGDAGNHSLTFTPTENKVYFRFYSNTSGSETTNEVQYQNIQIEEGSVATSYSPHFTPIELCKIGDYQDYLFKRNNKWYVHKKIGKVVFNGTENWNKSSSTANTIFYLNGEISYINGSTSSSINLYCNYFEGKIVWARNVIGCELYPENSIRFGLTTSSTITTIEQWKTWLQTNNTIVYYVLATPIEEEITNSTLIEQLNILYTAQLNNEVNYINTETENLFPYINLKYNVVTQMPSPEKSSEIETVKGNNVVSVQGKNLFKEWISASINPNTGEISATPRNLTDKIFVKPSTVYTMWREDTGYAMYAIEFDKDDNYLATSVIVSADTTRTFTTNANTSYVRLYQYTAYSPTNKAQLELGSATPYIPYSKTDYPINLDGKNLFNMNNATYVKKYGSSYSVDGQEITVTPTTTWGNVTYSYKVENNTTYTLKMKITFEGTTQTRWWLSLGNEENDAVYNGGYIDLEDGYLIKTFTTTSKILTISFQGSTTIQPTSILFSEIQLELGSTATDYEPYIAPIELCKIGNYQDYLYKNNDKWYVHKVIGKKVVTSSETLAQTDSYSKVRYFKFNKNTNDIDYNKYNNADIFYTSAKNVKNVYNYDDEYMIGKISPQAENVRYWVGFPKGTTLAQAKEKLVGSILYYVLAEPTETEITSLTLIEQLNNLYTAQLNNGINYIITETGNLLPYIDLKYNVVTQMPSPERPSEVKVVKGENVVSVQSKNMANLSILGKVPSVSTGELVNYGGAGCTELIEIDNTQEYVFSFEMMTVYDKYVFFYDENKVYITNKGNPESGYKLNDAQVFSRTKYVRIRIDKMTNFKNIQLEQNSQATPYVPYSKTDYPIDLVAENLFDKDDARILRGYVYVSDKKINPSNSDYSVIVKVKPSTKYIVTKMANNPESKAKFRLGTATNYPQMGGARDNVCNQVISNDTATELSITTESNDNYLVIFCYNSNSTTTLNEMLGSLVVREAEPIYKEMCKIGDYKDYFHKDSGKWYVHKEIGKKIFDGTEFWRAVATKTTDVYRMLTTSLKGSILAPATSSTQFLAFCSRFKPIIADDTYKNNEGISCARDENVHIYMETYNTSTSVNDFKTWLSNNNVTLYYVLATPAETEITNSTLIEQLEAIAKAKSVKDKTYITQTNEEIPFIIDATAIKEYEEVQ